MPELSLSQVAILVCAVGLAVTVPINLTARLRLAALLAGQLNDMRGNTTGPQDPLPRLYALSAVLIALVDLSLASWFGYLFWVSVTDGHRAFLVAVAPLKWWLGVGVVRLALEFTVRAMRRKLRAIYSI